MRSMHKTTRQSRATLTMRQTKMHTASDRSAVAAVFAVNSRSSWRRKATNIRVNQFRNCTSAISRHTERNGVSSSGKLISDIAFERICRHDTPRAKLHITCAQNGRLWY